MKHVLHADNYINMMIHFFTLKFTLRCIGIYLQGMECGGQYVYIGSRVELRQKDFIKEDAPKFMITLCHKVKNLFHS